MAERQSQFSIPQHWTVNESCVSSGLAKKCTISNYLQQNYSNSSQATDEIIVTKKHKRVVNDNIAQLPTVRDSWIFETIADRGRPCNTLTGKICKGRHWNNNELGIVGIQWWIK